jgi:ribosomal protein S12 methylthiotransferase
MKRKRFLIVTLGCFRNEVESDLMRSALTSLGLEETSSMRNANIVLINTCGFISEACDEGIDTILELDEIGAGLNEKPPMLAVGCMSQRYGEALMREMPEISGVIGTGWQDSLADAVRELLEGGRYEKTIRPPRMSRVRRTIDSSDNATLFVRIADGCDRKCRFCAIPSIRGKYESRPARDICEEISRLCAGREREVVLVAQDLTSYGRGLGDRTDIVALIRRITTIPEVRWLRLLYLQPEGLTTKLVQEMSENSRVCDYFDIPFQHGSESVLRRMGRPGNADAYLRLIETIRGHSPEASLRSTFMVGYPGETKEEFGELVRFIQEARFDWLGAFVFSAEKGTEAASLPGRVPAEVAVSRYNMLIEVQDRIEESALSRFEGRMLEVVVDGISEIEPYELVGRSYREAPVVDGVIYLRRGEDVARPATRAPGEFTEALITGREGLDLVGYI